MKTSIIEGMDFLLTDETHDKAPVVMIGGKPHARTDTYGNGQVVWELVQAWVDGCRIVDPAGGRWTPLTNETRALAYRFLRGEHYAMPVAFGLTKDGRPLTTFNRFYSEGVEMTPAQIRDFARILLMVADDCEKEADSTRKSRVYRVTKEF